MNITISFKKGFLLALVLLAHNNIFSQEKNKEVQTIAPVSDFEVKELATQIPILKSEIDDGSKADYINTNNLW